MLSAFLSHFLGAIFFFIVISIVSSAMAKKP